MHRTEDRNGAYVSRELEHMARGLCAYHVAERLTCRPDEFASVLSGLVDMTWRDHVPAARHALQGLSRGLTAGKCMKAACKASYEAEGREVMAMEDVVIAPFKALIEDVQR